MTRNDRPQRSVEDVYEAFAPKVLGYFRAHAIPDAEDLTGDVFVSIAGALDRFRGDDAALQRWVFTVAHHRLVDRYRRQARRREDLVADPPEGASDEIGEPTDPDLVRALQGLTPAQREVVLLRTVADLPISAVARIVRKRPGAVKMLHARALEELRRTLEGRDLSGGRDVREADGPR